MSNLPATLDATNAADFARAMGLVTESRTILPTLRINYRKQHVDKETQEKIKLTKGLWTINNGKEDVYGTDLATRILAAGYQVREWDETKEEYKSETIFFTVGWDKNPEDTSGGCRCGKVFNRDLDKLSESEQAAQAQKKFYRVFWGIATLKGKDMHGNDAEAVNIPFISRLRGQSFMPLCDYLDSYSTDDPVINYNTEWDIEEGEHASTDFWIPKPKRGKKSMAHKDSEVMATAIAIREWIDSQNKEVMDAWNKANGMKTAQIADTTEIEAVVLDDEFESDDIPF